MRVSGDVEAKMDFERVPVMDWLGVWLLGGGKLNLHGFKGVQCLQLHCTIRLCHFLVLLCTEWWEDV